MSIEGADRRQAALQAAAAEPAAVAGRDEPGEVPGIDLRPVTQPGLRGMARECQEIAAIGRDGMRGALADPGEEACDVVLHGTTRLRGRGRGPGR